MIDCCFIIQPLKRNLFNDDFAGVKMLFTELIFIPFLVITYFCFYFAKNRLRPQLSILLTASLVFYAWWDIRFLGLILASAIFNFFLGKYIHLLKGKKKNLLYITGLVVDVGVLGFFKYYNFFIDSLNSLFNSFGIKSDFSLLTIILPLGLSFYTFWTITYLVDIYTERTQPTDSLLKYLVFSICFPHMIAGPIVRAKDYLVQLNDNLFLKSDHDGLFLILYGFAKKLFLADLLGRLVVNNVFSGTLSEYSSLELLFVIYCYSFQIFFDFSAYSDIAIGLGKLFGIQYPINFKTPSSAANPPEFWRKWHITLSDWLRDYLFLPIAYRVMRLTKASHFLKIKIERWGYMTGMLITMLLCGLWHGANWTFVLWGGLHGVYLVAHNLLPRRFKRKKRTPKFFRIFVFFNLIALTWVFFRAPSLEFAFLYLKGLFSFSTGFSHFPMLTAALLLGASVVVHFFIEPHLELLSKLFNKLHWTLHAGIIYALFLLMAFLMEKDTVQQAFIYFQF
ncbi:MAG: MBOAT family protein [bacterium]|nr:MBOAT family protein [bacterium]